MTRRCVVYKYRISSTGRSSVQMPGHAQLLAVQNQDELVQVWALCDPAQPVMVPRHFMALKTGEHVDLDDTARFVGTVQLTGGRYVAHIFEVFA